ncbi:hypothetical protein [Sinorhizobium fredii]|uniref:hypothetical protein n=1 Tax=Rhizobium fredii TaxID=380 RepID=UPI0012950F5A|nr:hypothetical protein [Sinorhizobium fredii]MQW97572.1 hypothetical protein [Sinorhizobium fredii]
MGCAPLNEGAFTSIIAEALPFSADFNRDPHFFAVFIRRKQHGDNMDKTELPGAAIMFDFTRVAEVGRSEPRNP